MAVQSRQKKTKEKKVLPVVCVTCGEKGEFYKSKNLIYSYRGELPICKNCIQKMFEEFYRRFQDYELTMVEVCKKLNCCFVKSLFDSALSQLQTQGTDLVGAYFRNYNSSKTKKDATFFDSDIFEINANVIRFTRTKEESIEDSEEEFVEEEVSRSEFLIGLFGEGFDSNQYDAMERKYNSLMNNYSAPTAMHTEALITYVKYKCQEEACIARGNVEDAKKWGDLSSKAATAAKLNPSQFSQADLQGGLNTFSDIFKAVEQSKDVISILPEFKARPHDTIDFLLWCYINYARELEGLPRCTYSDVYKFYDDRVEEYIKSTGDPYGIFQQDYSVENRESVYRHISDIENKDGTFVKAIEEGGFDE